MSREGRINRRGQYPKLSDIDHYEHNQTSLPYGSVMTLRPALSCERLIVSLHVHHLMAYEQLPKSGRLESQLQWCQEREAVGHRERSP